MRLFLNSLTNSITLIHQARGFREFISEYRVSDCFVWTLQDLVEHSYQGTETPHEFFAEFDVKVPLDLCLTFSA